MAALILRATFGFALHDDGPWYKDKALVGSLVDVVLATDLASAITHAGVYGAEKAAKGLAAIRKAVVTGRSDAITMRDGAASNLDRTVITFDLDDDTLRVTIRVGPPALATRAATVLSTIEAIGCGLVDAMKELGALKSGYTEPMGEGFAYPRVRPPVIDRRFPPSSILDLVDPSSSDGAAKLAKASVPKPARRTAHDDLVLIRWIDSVEDERAVAIAAGRHEQWISRILPMEPEAGWNEEGDRLVELSDRKARAPFTMYDPEEEIGYKAIIVDPKGEPDDEVWAQMVKAVAAKKSGVKAIRLIAPLRKLALAIGPRARKAGFDAVLYPSDDNQLWDPAPSGWWIDDEPAAGGGKKSARSRD